MSKTDRDDAETLDQQLEALLAQDPLLLMPAITRRMLDQNPLTDAERIEQRICSVFLYLYRLKCDPTLEDEWRLCLTEHSSDALRALGRELLRRERRERLAQLETEPS
ncbi:MAG: hypothetical protein PVI91_10300 [Gammaproteobacteria bacterium]|jgi:hypothetical protein